MVKRREIRNSTAEFLIFQAESKTDGIEVMYVEKTIWCTQDAIAILFDKSRTTITEHLNNIFKEGELQKDSVCRKFRRTASDGKEYNTQFYNLDAIISVGYRVNSIRARSIQTERFRGECGVHCNAQMTPLLIERFAQPDRDGREALRLAMQRLNLSARAYERILKMARTIADLAGSEKVEAMHIAEAIGYRNLDRGDWAERGI